MPEPATPPKKIARQTDVTWYHAGAADTDALYWPPYETYSEDEENEGKAENPPVESSESGCKPREPAYPPWKIASQDAVRHILEMCKEKKIESVVKKCEVVVEARRICKLLSRSAILKQLTVHCPWDAS